jgi:hypothetical protein
MLLDYPWGQNWQYVLNDVVVVVVVAAYEVDGVGDDWY